MSDWRPIETAPKDGTHVDLWAKHWRSDTDTFITARFTDCTWSKGDSMSGRRDYWLGLSDGWHPVFWMPLPDPPAEKGAEA